MPLKVITQTAQIPNDASLYLKLAIDVANGKIKQMAEDLKNSAVKNLDPNDGREFIIMLKVNPKSGSVDTILDYKPPTQFQ